MKEKVYRKFTTCEHKIHNLGLLLYYKEERGDDK